jgi:hypothetical protein
MSKKILFMVVLSFCASAYSAELGEIKKGEGTRITFNRLSLEIPKDWNYSVNPMARPGTDQLQLFSDDRNRTVLITLTHERSDITLTEAVRKGGLMMMQRGHSFPGFENCPVNGSGQGGEIWGRKGILTTFNFYKDEKQDDKNIVMRIYNFGESLGASKEVLFIVAFIVGDEKEDTEKVLKTIKIL